MFFIMSKTRHALLLPGGRFLSPRINRDEGAEQPRNKVDSWPQTRRFHEREQARYRTRTETIRVRKQSVIAFNPRQQARQQTVRIREPATALIVRKQASARSTRYPQTVRRLGQSASGISPLTNIGRKPRQAKNWPGRHIIVSMFPPISFPVHIRQIPAHVHI